jgi:hypothetical protein
MDIIEIKERASKRKKEEIRNKMRALPLVELKYRNKDTKEALDTERNQQPTPIFKLYPTPSSSSSPKSPRIKEEARFERNELGFRMGIGIWCK